MKHDTCFDELAWLRGGRQRLESENAQIYREFHAALTTIGGRLYTQGTGAKWQMDLLSFVRDERARLEKEYDNAP